MITPAHVQAEVVDIRPPRSVIPSDLVADANILYWLFYSNFSSVAYAGGKRPSSYQLTEYDGYWRRAERAGTLFHAVTAILGEFAKAAEYAEFETIWLTDPLLPQPDPANPVAQFDPRVCKFSRYHYIGQIGTVRRTVDNMIAFVRQSVLLLPQFPSPDDLQNEAMREWLPSCGDFPDAVIVASAKKQSIPHILSDDMDVATFPGITLYTANARTINAASSAGKLR